MRQSTGTEAGMTIGRLAKAVGVSRATLLYYDRLGLLRPTLRSDGNYRLYSPGNVQRLRQIRLYRQMGIPLREIAAMLDGEGGPSAAVLERHLEFLERQIDGLRHQQRQVVRLLEQLNSGPQGPGKRKASVRRSKIDAAGRAQSFSNEENEMVNKQRWVEIMRAAGLSDEDMHNWHRQFERLEPAAHEEFLQSLAIPPEEIEKIRKWSRT